jgi:molecular chaperone DnaK
MKLGIDFGTTRTVVSVLDHGHYPNVSFCTTEGDWMDYYPSLIAVKDNEFLYGFEAQGVFDNAAWVTIRSIKSFLKHAFKHKTIELRDHSYVVTELITNFLKQFREDLINQSNLEFEDEKITVSIAVPAHSNNVQRFITAECFNNAGFEVLNMINEPSAATGEYIQSFYQKTKNITKKYLLVYDLGGGTFDASISEIHDKHHRIIATEGIEMLGGDQFDEVMAKMILDKQPENFQLDSVDEVRLNEICKLKKETITPYSKNILLEWAPQNDTPKIYKLSVKDYYLRCEPLVDETINILENLLDRVSVQDNINDFMVYLVGGMANFPLINRKLKTIFGKNMVRKSKYVTFSVSMGLAAMMDHKYDYILKESLTRYFGLWREEAAGEELIFDPIFQKDQTLPAKGELPIVYNRQYAPSHNIGVFRFQECSRIQDGKPMGMVTVWKKIKFPFDPSLQGQDLSNIEVARWDHPANFSIKEIYFLNYRGEISVQLINNYNGINETFLLSRMESEE